MMGELLTVLVILALPVVLAAGILRMIRKFLPPPEAYDAQPRERGKRKFPSEYDGII
jgi:hypothetical protein